MPLRPLFLFSLILPLAGWAANPAAPAETDHPPLKGVTPVDNPAEAARRLTVAPGLQASLWAAEPDLENPVSFTFDHRGRCFVAETFRRRTSALDIRIHKRWLEESLAMRSVDDRLNFLQGAFENQKAAAFWHIQDFNGDKRFDWRDLAVESERVKKLEDRDGDGRADHSSVFAEGFNSAVTGLGAGVLAHGDDVFYTCLPDLWRLSESGGKVKKEALLSGFGVHITYNGHDLHGLVLGPDGKLYWSIGDAGARVTTKEGRVLDVPDTGAVFRANLDGSDCELVMTGLRNPEELAFNDAGDLFTADNNGDGGDLARWVQVVEDGDAGWQIGWQTERGLGAWTSEKLWSPDTARTALGLVPPLGTIGHGPAGIAYYPGTGLPEIWRDHFFVCDFPGGVRAFRLRPRGASYEIEATPRALHDNGYQLENKLVWGFYPTDVEFGVEGGAYVLDWVRDVDKPGKGRIFRLHDPATDASAPVQETKRLLGEGMTGRGKEELIALLGHADRRVRLAAQFALVGRGASAELQNLAVTAGPRLARLHALWGLGQLGRTVPEKLAALPTLLTDADSEVRAQAARVLGEARVKFAAPALIAALADAEPRVRFQAALALSKVPDVTAVPALFTMLRENADADAFLRHAGVLALAACADAPALLAQAKDPAEAVRAAVLLSLRRQGNPEVARFLEDPNPQLVLEAARAIHDTPIEAAFAPLSTLATNPKFAPAIAMRAINANYRLGTTEAAARLAALVEDPEAPEPWRVEAAEALGEWNQPAARDRFLGLWRPLPVTRDSKAAAAMLNRLAFVLPTPRLPDRVRLALVNAVGALEMHEAEVPLNSVAGDPEASEPLRIAALRALADLSSPKLGEAVKSALASQSASLRAEALRLETRLKPEQAVEAASNALKMGSVAEQQNAVRVLAALKDKEADKLLGKWLERCLTGEAPAALHLDLFEAAAERDTEDLHKKLAEVRAARGTGRLAEWRECLQGGDAVRGREVFSEKAEAGCLRCHQVRGVGGTVGPDLAGLGARLDRVAILKAILFPNETLAPGYENTMLTLKGGEQLIGVITAEEGGQVTIRTLSDGKTQTVAASQISVRQRLPSTMPEGLGAVLGKRDLRDIVEYLAGQK